MSAMAMVRAAEETRVERRSAPASRGAALAIDLTERERELGAIVLAYNEVTERLKGAHEQLNHEVRRLREELAAKNKELRRRERLAALGEMAAGLAHEVRNPLGGIALYVSLLEQELADRPAARATAGKISHGVRDLNRLVGEILDFAQEDRLERSDHLFGDIMVGVLEKVSPWVSERRTRIELAEACEDVVLNCDVHRFGRVMLNLVMNAVQAAGNDGRVWVGACKLGRGIEIEVSDNGHGIAAEHVDRIFNPFFTTRASGTGLGLSIVHRIVEAHGWTIRAENRAEGGARFVIRARDEATVGE